MFTLVLFVLAGIGIAYFATQNAQMVPIMIAGYPSAMPLYLVVTGALLIGLLLSWIISLFSSFSSALTLHGKDARLQKAHTEIEHLTNENRRLELENAHLKGRSEEYIEEKQPVRKPTFVERLRGSYS